MDDGADGVYAPALHQCPHVAAGGATTQCLDGGKDFARLFAQMQLPDDHDGRDTKPAASSSESVAVDDEVKVRKDDDAKVRKDDSAKESAVKGDVNACASCGFKSSTPWLCATCGVINCGRYEKGCAAQHALSCQHPVSIGLYDLSFWCYSCEHYLWAPSFRVLYDIFDGLHFSKFNEKCVFPFTGDGDTHTRTGDIGATLHLK